MKIKVLPDVQAVAREAAIGIAEMARAAVREHGRFIMAVSGGHTPWQMLRFLADQEIPWEGVHVVQVDERLAPVGGSGPQPHPFTGKSVGPGHVATRPDICHAGGGR